MSQYSFRKPTIVQLMDIADAAAKGDMPALVRLLDEVAIDDILDLPFTELGAIAEDYAAAVRIWQDEKVESNLPGGMVDFLANLLGGEEKDG